MIREAHGLLLVGDVTHRSVHGDIFLHNHWHHHHPLV